MSNPEPQLVYRNFWLLLGYLLIGLIVYLSLTSKPLSIGPEFHFKDKLLHALAYFSVMIWFAQIYHNRLRIILWAVFFILLGAGLEYAQSFSPPRHGSVEDAIANTVGVLVGLILAGVLRNMLFRLEKLF